jgi:hypothetical protein
MPWFFMTTQERAREIKRRHSAALLQRDGVCGVGLEKDNKGSYALAIHVDASKPGIETTLPAMLEDCPVKIVRSGGFKKL